MVHIMDLSDAVIFNSSGLKSVVWNDFNKFKKGDTPVSICGHCKKRMSGSGISGTSHLGNNLIRCQRRANREIGQFVSRGKKRGWSPDLGNASSSQDQKPDENLAVAVVNAINR